MGEPIKFADFNFKLKNKKKQRKNKNWWQWLHIVFNKLQERLTHAFKRILCAKRGGVRSHSWFSTFFEFPDFGFLGLIPIHAVAIVLQSTLWKNPLPSPNVIHLFLFIPAFAWWIIVVVVLVILLVLVILVVLILYKRKRDRERKEQQQGSRFNALELDARSVREIILSQYINLPGWGARIPIIS